MNARSEPHPTEPRILAAAPVCALLVCLALFPPETRGESLAGCALLAALLVSLNGRRLRSGSAVTLLIAASLAWALSLAAVAPGKAVEPSLVLWLGAALGVGVARLPRRLGHGPAAAWAMVIAGSWVSLHALYQALGGLEADAALLERLGTIVPDQNLVLARLRQGRAFAAFPTPAALGGFLAITLPVTGWMAASARRGRRYGLLGLVLVQGAGLLASASLSAGLALAGALWLVLLTARPTRKAALGLAAAGAVLLAALLAVRGISVLDPADRENPIRLRAGNARVALAVVRDHPWLGVGPGGFGEAFPQYRRPGDNESRHVHVLPLELAADLGAAPGLAGAAVFFVLFLAPLRRTGGQETPGWQRGLAVGLAAFALHNLADFTAFLPSLLWIAAIGRGLVENPRADEPRAPAGASLRLVLLCLVWLAAGALVAAGLSANALHRARTSALSGEHDDALAAGRRAARLAPWDPDAHLVEAQAWLARADRVEQASERAAEAVERAIRLSPVRPAARAVRARLRQAAGDLPGAYVDLFEAARLYPLDAEYARLRDALARQLPHRPTESAP